MHWKFWQKRPPMLAETPPLQWRGEEEHSIPELGGRVAVRGLTAAEMAIAVRGVQTLPARRDQAAALGVTLLIGGVVYPRLDYEAAYRFAIQYPARAVFLMDRIRYLSKQRLEQAGLIR